MRPIVSYDDITLPYQPQPQQQHTNSLRSSPHKKRKRFQNKHSSQPLQHHDSNNSDTGTGTPALPDGKEEDEESESRELTHNEIWDDSALIDAWNAATEEYEAYNGPDKGWKTEPVHKSPLWYNVPPASPKKGLKQESIFHSPSAPVDSLEDVTGTQEDSRPLDFDTFVPTHDPSLGPPPETGSISHHLLHPPGRLVSKDEAFSRALGAMYWSGYWTAVYHCQTKSPKRNMDEALEQESDDEVQVEEDEEFVSTQR